MGDKLKILKIKVGNVFIDGKSIPVFQDAWEKKSKKGERYFEVRSQVFIQEIEKKKEEAKSDDL